MRIRPSYRCRGVFFGLLLVVAGALPAPTGWAQSAAPSGGANDAQQAAASRFEQANQLVRDAVPLLEADPSRAREQLDSATGLYRLALTDGSLSRSSRAELNYNLGTAGLLRGDLATAVLYLRRAESLCSPFDFGLREQIQTNLAEARRRVRPAEGAAASANKSETGSAPGAPVPADSTWRERAEATEQAAARTLKLVPTSWLAAFAIATSMIAGGMATLGFLGRLPRGGWIWTGLVGIAGLGALGVLEWRRQTNSRLVPAVVLRSTQPRSAPDDLTGGAVGSPLPPGSEVTILGYLEPADPSAPRWVKARDSLALTPGECWLPSGAVATVSESTQNGGSDGGAVERDPVASPGQSLAP